MADLHPSDIHPKGVHPFRGMFLCSGELLLYLFLNKQEHKHREGVLCTAESIKDETYVPVMMPQIVDVQWDSEAASMWVFITGFTPHLSYVEGGMPVVVDVVWLDKDKSQPRGGGR